MAIMAQSFLCHRFNAGGRPHIQLQTQSPTAKVLDLPLKRFKSRRIATGQHEIGPRPRQSTRKVLPKAAAGSRHEGNAVRQVKRPMLRFHKEASFYGSSRTFSNPGSFRYKRSNQSAPSSSGATALINGAADNAPRA